MVETHRGPFFSSQLSTPRSGFRYSCRGLTRVVVTRDPEAVAIVIDEGLRRGRERLGRQRQVGSALAVEQLQATVTRNTCKHGVKKKKLVVENHMDYK